MSSLVDCNKKISELIYVLKEETKLLRQGKLDGLDIILSQKSKATSELEALTSSLDTRQHVKYIMPQIEMLKRMADENSLMLMSVMNGLRAARERLQTLHQKHAQVGAYGQCGSKLHIVNDLVNIQKMV